MERCVRAHTHAHTLPFRYVHIYTHTHTNIHTYIHTYIRTYIHTLPFRYSNRVIPEGLSPRQRARVLGGQLCLWSENMNGNNLPVRLWQIGAAGAEVRVRVVVRVRVGVRTSVRVVQAEHL